MDKYRELAENLRSFGRPQTVSIYQGIVRKVKGLMCDVEIGGITIPEVRLRASLASEEQHLLITPAIGSSVIVGSLSGDLAELVVLAVDRAESVTFNGGKLGGLINIEVLTAKLNALIKAFNTHTHISGAKGTPTATPMKQAELFSASDYEDTTIKH